MLDGRVQTEHYVCGPIDEGRVARCGYILQGATLQGSLVAATFTLANGESRTLSHRFRCSVATAEGQVCLRND
jgi:hypothetical protein